MSISQSLLAGLTTLCLGCGSINKAPNQQITHAGTDPQHAAGTLPTTTTDAGTSILNPATHDGSVSATAGHGGNASQATAGSPKPATDNTDDAGTEALRPVTLRFKAAVGSTDFACGTSYAAPSGSALTYTPADFRFFISDIRLITRAGTEIPVTLDVRKPVQTSEVALIDFGDDTGSCFLLLGTRRKNLTVTGTIPAGDYTSVVFTTGVPETLNHQDVTQAAPPLDDTSMHWGWSNGYRFVSLMLDAVHSASGMTTQTGVHIGSTGCTGSPSAGIQCSRPHRNRIQLDNFDPDTSTIVADFGAAVAGLDLTIMNECHSAEAQCAPTFAAFGLDRTSKQRVFRLE